MRKAWGDELALDPFVPGDEWAAVHLQAGHGAEGSRHDILESEVAVQIDFRRHHCLAGQVHMRRSGRNLQLAATMTAERSA